MALSRRGIFAVAASAMAAAAVKPAKADECPFAEDTAEYHRWWRRHMLLRRGADALRRDVAMLRSRGFTARADEYEALARAA